MNGLDTLKRIKQISPNTQVILVTAKKDIELLIDLMNAGADGYLTKDNLTFNEIKMRVELMQKKSSDSLFGSLLGNKDRMLNYGLIGLLVIYSIIITKLYLFGSA
ncbi:MAG: response regulator [Flavobacteriales bacterium]|nr:response regulator [Flavobacteriales bacterium]